MATDDARAKGARDPMPSMETDYGRTLGLNTVLALVHPTNATLNKEGRWVLNGIVLPQVTVVAALNESGTFTAAFEVLSASAPYVNESLSRGASQQGLWQWDVVEAFIQPDNGSPTYYEFVLSPLGQHFEQEVFKPRVRMNKNLRSGVKVTSEVEQLKPFEEYRWTARMEVSLKQFGWNETTGRVKWNAFAILGNPSDPKTLRSYWSLNLPKQATPDFHKPEYFTALE